MGILSLLLWTPAFGALLLTLTPSSAGFALRLISQISTAICLGLAVYLLICFDPLNGSAQFTETWVINQELGNNYALGIDGLSMPLLLIGTLLTWIALYTAKELNLYSKTFYICLLLLEFSMLGVFLSLDWALFYVFWEATLIPLFFLIDRWGNSRRHSASLNFLLYNIGGSIFILVSLFAIGEFIPQTGGALFNTFEQAAQGMSLEKQIWVLIGFLIGFGVKIPIFPLHGWLPLVLVEAPTAVRILLAGILLKMGVYGLIRVIPMMSPAFLEIQAILSGLALFSISFGALLAWRQTDLRAMLAYACISSMGIIFLDIVTCEVTSLTGAVLLISAHALTMASLFFLIGRLHNRTGTYNIQHYSSISQAMPRFAILTTIALLAMTGIPGSLNFVAQLFSLIGGLPYLKGWMVILNISLLISAAYVVRTLSILFTGPTKLQMLRLDDLTLSECFMAGLLIIASASFGFYPAPLIKLSTATLNAIASIISTGSA